MAKKAGSRTGATVKKAGSRPGAPAGRTRSTSKAKPDSSLPTTSSSARSLYDDPLLYERAFASRTSDIEYFCQLAEQAGGLVLEYGCGSGRVTLPLAQRGIEVLAVDQSATMLAVLKQRLLELPPDLRSRVELRQGDMRRLRIRRRFPLVLATFNVTAHLPSFRDLQAWLRRVRDALTDDGELVFDAALPAPEEIEADPEERLPLPSFRHPETGQRICHDERYEYAPGSQVLLVESDHWLRGSQDRLTTQVHLRQWFPKELESLLRYEGFSVDLRADYTDMPVVLCQDTLIVRARSVPS